MQKKLADSLLDSLESLDELYGKKKKIKEILNNGGVRDLRGVIDLGIKLADCMLDPDNKEHPTPESKEDQEKVRAAKHFLRAAMGRLRGVKELYGDGNIPDPGPQSDGANTIIDFEG